MTLAETLLPLPVLGPLAVAFALLAGAHWLPPRVADAVSTVSALAVAGLCLWLAHAAIGGTVVHWFGGWTPASSHRPGVVLGIGFAADPASAVIAGFAALIFAASFVFAWGYFDKVHSHFHVLMLLFLAGMTGFCLTRDLFDLFVWFELMSVAAYALTAYPIGPSSLEGAFNFIVVNALASFAMLAGVGLVYARAGSFDFAAVAAVAGALRHDTVLTAGFVLIAAALLTKGAILPFHFWLSDAHAVAPSPVSVVFSGIMVGLGPFGLAKLVNQVGAGDADFMVLVHGALTMLGAATALIGGAMAWVQRHLKRLLAFSTIAHMGIVLTALAATEGARTAGVLLYLVGHGLVKGSLFMVAGILLAKCASADEIALYGQGRKVWPAGIAMGLAGLLLGGAPVGLLHAATEMATSGGGWRTAVAVVSTALTGAAVLRAALRIFARTSGVPGAEAFAPTEREQEASSRSTALMLTPVAALLALALVPGEVVRPWLAAATAGFMRAPVVLPTERLDAAAFAPLALTLTIVGASLVRQRPVRAVSRAAVRIATAPARALQALHSGISTDYVAWWLLGVAALAEAVAQM
ncbi:MAG: NADH dehydrogenase [Sphingomonadaceae bacterium]|nr:NADH dehydrogenase [Sphingomonadaceae bacterium]